LVEVGVWTLDVGNKRMINLQNITAVEVARDNKSLIALQGDAARGFLQLIDFSNPLQVGGVVGAIITGQLVLTFKDNQGKDASKKFVIYNNRLVQSEDDANVYYRCSEGFGHALILGVR
jgi:hypothetical protein